MRAREAKLRDLGGLVVEMYRRGAFREDLLEEACADAVGIDARLAEIDDLLHGERHAPRCECGAPILRGSHFCPNCGRALDGSGERRRGGLGLGVEQARSRDRGRGAGLSALRRRARPGQDYCVDCGLRLPAVDGRVASLRRGWMRRLGWYPGDWIWVGLPTLARRDRGRGGRDRAHRTRPSEGRHDDRRLVEPAATRRDAAAPRRRHALPHGPRADGGATTQTTATPRPDGSQPNGRSPGRRRVDGWTIVLISYPSTRGRGAPLADREARRRARPPRGRRARVVATSRASTRATRSSSAASTAPARMPKRRLRAPARQVSEPPIQGKSPAESVGGTLLDCRFCCPIRNHL